MMPVSYTIFRAYYWSNTDQNILVSYPSKSVMIKSDGISFGLQEPFLDDSGIGMSIISDENENPAFAAYTNDLISAEDFYERKQAQR